MKLSYIILIVVGILLSIGWMELYLKNNMLSIMLFSISIGMEITNFIVIMLERRLQYSDSDIKKHMEIEPDILHDTKTTQHSNVTVNDR